jgi:hypothetical protein
MVTVEYLYGWNRYNDYVPKGIPVYRKSSYFDSFAWDICDNRNKNKMPCIGLTRSPADSRDVGIRIITSGELFYLDTSMWGDGAELYVGRGVLVDTPPENGYHQPVAQVLVQDSQYGKLLVHIGGGEAMQTQESVIAELKSMKTSQEQQLIIQERILLGMQLQTDDDLKVKDTKHLKKNR